MIRWRSISPRSSPRPSSEHWCGTDAFGRDICSRLIYGSRTALVIGFTSSFVGSTLGAMLGVASAYFGGRIDNIIQRFMDILLAFPLIVLALVVVAALPPHSWSAAST